jgi:MSHA pilin protein MshC
MGAIGRNENGGPRGPLFHSGCRTVGFSLMELVAVLVVMGVLAVVVMPRFWGSTFDDARFFDESITALRHAQRSALTMQRTVCVGLTGTTVTLTFDATYGGATCPGANLPRPDGASPYLVTAPGGGGFIGVPASFRFDRVGSPSAAQTLSLSGGHQIVIEPVTGHVHD